MWLLVTALKEESHFSVFNWNFEMTKIWKIEENTGIFTSGQSSYVQRKMWKMRANLWLELSVQILVQENCIIFRLTKKSLTRRRQFSRLSLGPTLGGDQIFHEFIHQASKILLTKIIQHAKILIFDHHISLKQHVFWLKSNTL